MHPSCTTVTRTVAAVDLLLDVQPADGGVERVDELEVVVRAFWGVVDEKR